MVNENIKKAVKAENRQVLTKELMQLLRQDRAFKTPAFEEAWDYVQKKVPDFAEPFDGEDFAPEADWNKEYLAEQISELEDNFCQRRIDHIKAVSQKVYHQGQGAAKASPQTHTATAAGQTKTTSRPSVGNPRGKVNNKVRQDVRERNVRHIINDLIMIIHNDRGLYTSEFADSLAYVKAAGIDVEEPFDGGDFAPESAWNDQYWAEQMAKLRFNFCQERIEHVKAIGRKLYPRVEPYTQTTGGYGQYQQQQQTYPGGSQGSSVNPWKAVAVAAAIAILGVGALLLFSKN